MSVARSATVSFAVGCLVNVDEVNDGEESRVGCLENVDEVNDGEESGVGCLENVDEVNDGEESRVGCLVNVEDEVNGNEQSWKKCCWVISRVDNDEVDDDVPLRSVLGGGCADDAEYTKDQSSKFTCSTAGGGCLENEPCAVGVG